jgi:hypothetical protein
MKRWVWRGREIGPLEYELEWSPDFRMWIYPGQKPEDYLSVPFGFRTSYATKDECLTAEKKNLSSWIFQMIELPECYDEEELIEAARELKEVTLYLEGIK